ncbi:hypothetical protein HYX16_01735 [Candidatus Woesearchaeota archaeon]|nr:hypothetical protein [Candidatus Woesearchaeota archaeon]
MTEISEIEHKQVNDLNALLSGEIELGEKIKVKGKILGIVDLTAIERRRKENFTDSTYYCGILRRGDIAIPFKYFVHDILSLSLLRAASETGEKCTVFGTFTNGFYGPGNSVKNYLDVDKVSFLNLEGRSIV